MANRSTDALFQLVKSLEKGEKRNFKLYIKRNSDIGDLKIIQLFDTLDKLESYDEHLLLKKAAGIAKPQLSNLKAHLYKEILSSLRLIKNEGNIDIHLHEMMDQARILFNKGLYMQSLKVLDRLKETAGQYQQITYIQQALFFEKKIEAFYITRSIQDRADQLARESDLVNDQIRLVNKLSNLALQLYSWYIKNGHARNAKDVQSLKAFYAENLPAAASQANSFYEKLYLYQCYVWFAFIRQDFLMYYRYAQKWVDVFSQNPNMLRVEMSSYIKGMHNLMSAHFSLMNEEKLGSCIRQFEWFTKQKILIEHENARIMAFQYLYTARINLYFLQGKFSKGVRLVPFLESMLQEYHIYLDTHRVLVFKYKIACLYFGSGNHEKAIDYLNTIINHKADLRTDLQCYARLLHLIAHYELGNFDLLEYLIKSVYRYMARMENLSKVEEAMFAFLRRSFRVGAHALKPEFEKLLIKLKKFEGNPLESRAFAYLDVISWLESKINDIDVQDVIREKFKSRKKR